MLHVYMDKVPSKCFHCRCCFVGIRFNVYMFATYIIMCYTACTSDGDQCNAIPHTVCDEDQCVCEEGFEQVEEAGVTKDSCKGKTLLYTFSFSHRNLWK